MRQDPPPSALDLAHEAALDTEQRADLVRLCEQVSQLLPAAELARAMRAAQRLCRLRMGAPVLQATVLAPAVLRARAKVLVELAESTGSASRAASTAKVESHQLLLDLGIDVSKEVEALVDGIVRVGAVRWRDLSAESPENVRRMFVSIASELRVVVILLADRVEQMTAARENVDSIERRALARETLDVFTPLANRLGIFQLKWELEDLALREIDPDAYRRISEGLAERRTQRQAFVEEMVIAVRGVLRGHEVRANVYGRPKHIYSIYKKMLSKRLAFEHLHDITAIRVLVDDIASCYTVLGLLHGAFTPIPGEFDDYIARPKSNGYQSLHTVVVGPGGRSVEVQIRTHEMHRWAEYGVAAHWAYKESATPDADPASGNEAAAGKQSSKGPGKSSDRLTAGDAAIAKRFNVVRELLEWQRELGDPSDLADSLKSDIFEDRVYAFTPRGDIIELPQGATPLDFAYRVHTSVGHRCRGALVNGVMVTLDRTLHSGDRVEILTRKHPEPSRDWLNPHLGYLKTSSARHKVRSWFKQLDRDAAIASGREVLERELARLAPGQSPAMAELAREHGFSNPADFYAAIGFSELGANHVAAKVADQARSEAERDVVSWDANRQAPRGTARERSLDPGSELRLGMTAGDSIGVLSSPAKCCHPLPGDDIVGFVSRGRGLVIHRKDCSNLDALDPSRLMDLDWQAERTRRYEAVIRVRVVDRPGALRDVASVLSELGINVRRTSSTSDLSTSEALIEISVEVASHRDLVRALDLIERESVVIAAYRVDG